MESNKDVVITRHPAKYVVELRINRPKARNALNRPVRESLADNFKAISEDPSIRCVILTGGDRVFAAGADLRDIADATPIEMYSRHVEKLWEAISACPKPIIAAVNGFALGGGCELAMHADVIIAGNNAQFGQPEIKVGIMPGAGGTQRLARAVGKFHAMKMLLTGLPISGTEAVSMGLASEVVDDDHVLDRALELAKLIADMPPIAAEQIKEVLLAGSDIPLNSALALERKAFQLLFDTNDQSEGMQAFFEKRKPVYSGE
tara:strand:+ start:44 stop:826 length:783 start_codon:yes stop_codon:yes gene_type:complete